MAHCGPHFALKRANIATHQGPMRTGVEGFAIPIDGERHQEGIRPDHFYGLTIV